MITNLAFKLPVFSVDADVIWDLGSQVALNVTAPIANNFQDFVEATDAMPHDVEVSIGSFVSQNFPLNAQALLAEDLGLSALPTIWGSRSQDFLQKNIIEPHLNLPENYDDMLTAPQAAEQQIAPLPLVGLWEAAGLGILGLGLSAYMAKRLWGLIQARRTAIRDEIQNKNAEQISKLDADSN